MAAEEDWVLRMECAKLIASQEVTEGGFNFRHGSAYLTASIEKAVRYAVSSDFSSEALAYFMMLWERLQNSRIALPATVETGSQRIVEFASGRKVPLVFQCSDVAIGVVCAENGGDPTGFLNWIGQLASLENSVYEHFLGGANFELREPISVADARVFRVLRELPNDSAYTEGYSLVPFCGESTFDAPIGEVVYRISLL